MAHIKHYKEQIEKLEKWAESVGAKLIFSSPMTDEEVNRFPSMIKPPFGVFSFIPPPSYRDFLHTCRSIQLEVNFGNPDDPDWGKLKTRCWIFDPATIVEKTGFVIIPENVSRVKGRYLTTNHLLGFAMFNGRGETYWTFITDKPDQDGELPILAHNVNEMPAARYIDTGEYENPGSIKISYPSFLKWFDAYVAELIQMSRDEFESNI